MMWLLNSIVKSKSFPQISLQNYLILPKENIFRAQIQNKKCLHGIRGIIMKKRIVIIILFVFHHLVQFFNIEEVATKDKLEEQYIHVFINEDGSARITEKRVAYLAEGTENYIVIGNLGESTILDFVVSENGKTYQYTHNWDINASQNEKTFKNGLIETNDGYELCWGIGEYGKHEYTIEYTITNFIKQLQDGQILFWRFVNDQTNIPPEEVTVVIETDSQLNQSTEKIWAFGFDGEINFADGKVIATNDRPLTKTDYVTVLVQFADGMFESGDYIDQSLEEIEEKAFEGSDYGKEQKSSGSSRPRYLDRKSTRLNSSHVAISYA